MYIIYSILVISSLIFVCYYLLNLLQQNHYHYNLFLKMYRNYFKSILFLSLGSLLYFNNIVFKILSIILLIIFIFRMIKKKYILKLNFTSRIYRIIFVNILINIIHLMLFKINYIIILVPIYLLLSMIILIPVEKIIGHYYIKKARNKLNAINPIIVAITGSAGKTSVKNYLYELLKDDYITFKTPKSYNTVLGITKAINENMNIKTEVAIFEFGASHKNDISKLLKVVKPDIGIITNILPQHLESFKKIENVFHEKLKVFDESKVCLFNSDIISPIIKKGKEVVTISEHKKSKYKLSDVLYTNEGMSFKINGYLFKTSLIGKCNLENVILAVICSNYLKLSFKKIENRLLGLKPVSNRLEIKKVNNKIIIDDSFNSNIKGFENAIEVLMIYKANKVVITPGIMECGKKASEINYKVGVLLGKANCDIFIIKNKNSKYIIKGLIDCNNDRYKVYDYFKDCYDIAINNYDVILIENDISDVYK